jgi:hypothetical protein
MGSSICPTISYTWCITEKVMNAKDVHFGDNSGKTVNFAATFMGLSPCQLISSLPPHDNNEVITVGSLLGTMYLLSACADSCSVA